VISFCLLLTVRFAIIFVQINIIRKERSYWEQSHGIGGIHERETQQSPLFSTFLLAYSLFVVICFLCPMKELLDDGRLWRRHNPREKNVLLL